MAELKKFDIREPLVSFFSNIFIQFDLWRAGKDTEETKQQLLIIRARITEIENEIGELNSMDEPLREIEELLEALRKIQLSRRVEKMEEYLISLRGRIKIQ